MYLANKPALLSPSSRDVNFQCWHGNRIQIHRPAAGGRQPARGPGLSDHLNKHSTTMLRPIRSTTVKRTLPMGTAEMKTTMTTLPPIYASSPSFGSRTLPPGGWQQGSPSHRAAPVVNRRLEKQWTKSVFQSLPRVAIHRSPLSNNLAKLTLAASAPELILQSQAVDQPDVPSRVPSKVKLTRISSIESGASYLSKTSEFLYEKQKAAADFIMPNRGRSKSGSDTSPRKGSKNRHGPPSLADVAHRWGLPLTTVTGSSKLFKEYASLPGLLEEEDVLRDGVIDSETMLTLVSKFAELASINANGTKHSPEEILGIIDKNNDGSIDFEEFTAWYREREFLEYMNLTKEEIEVRRVGQEMGVAICDMEYYKQMYDKFDTNGSGLIDYDEFGDLLKSLMKVDPTIGLPETRIAHFWQEADVDGSGEVDLQEFVSFYIKHFNPGADDPLEDFYEGIRRVTGNTI